MDDIAQDPTSSNAEEHAARGRAIWDRYCSQYGQHSALEDVIADLLHFADATVTGGAETVIDRAKHHHRSEQPSNAPRHPEPAEAQPPLFDEHGNYTPQPGTEYPFSVSDLARATARRLGAGLSARKAPHTMTSASLPAAQAEKLGDAVGRIAAYAARALNREFPHLDLEQLVETFTCPAALEGAARHYLAALKGGATPADAAGRAGTALIRAWADARLAAAQAARTD
ncbi:hypothetical protein [Streptomyces lydicus]|uniref:hypothetical protein n=1 Tax=Streptomyces lydicus TaxID=47763 RepID=UPI0036E64566